MEGQPSVVDLPMTNAHRAALRRATALKRKVYLGMFACFATVIPSLTVWLGHHLEGLLFGAGVAGLAVVVDRWFWRGPAQRSSSRRDAASRTSRRRVSRAWERRC